MNVAPSLTDLALGRGPDVVTAHDRAQPPRRAIAEVAMRR